MTDTGIDFFSFFEMSPDLVFIAGKDGYFKKVNPAVIEKFEYTEAELFASPISSFIFPEDRDITDKLRADLLRGKLLHNFQNRYVTKQGKILWLDWTSIYFPEKEIVFAIAKDITIKKQLELEAEEKYRKYKNLTTFFKSNIEKDRKYLAYELHEELAQLVSSVKMDIEWIAANESDLSKSSMYRIENAMEVSKMLIKTLQRISFSISPNMLNDFGLNATLEWLCKEFSILNGIPCSFESAYDEESLSQEIEVDFFRICQESLSNIIDHANATNVKISLEEIDNSIQLCITDNGCGFNVDEQKETPGFLSMRERVASLNAVLTIQSEKGMGTKIFVTISKNFNEHN